MAKDKEEVKESEEDKPKKSKLKLIIIGVLVLLLGGGGFLVIASLSLSAMIPFFGRKGLPYSDGYNIYWRTVFCFHLLFFYPEMGVFRGYIC